MNALPLRPAIGILSAVRAWRAAPESGPERCRAFLSVALGLLFVLANVGRAQDDSDAVTASFAYGNTLTGNLRSIANGEIILAGDRAVRMAADELIRLDFHHRPRLTTSRASLIRLVNGDRIVAGLTSMNDEALVALWKSYPDWPPVRIPAETIAGILMTVPEGAVQRSRAFAQVFGRREKTDVVLFLNGDRAAGDLMSFDQATLKLAQAGRPLEVELPRVRGIAFSEELSSLPAGNKPRIQVTLTDGSQLTGSQAAREPGGHLRFTASFGAPLDIPVSAVAAIRFFDGRTTYLSDLPAESAALRGFFGPSTGPALAKDANAAGGPLVVRGREFAKGLGTRSRSQIGFDLGGRFRRFQSLAALDDLSQGKGSVRFLVEVDGVRVFVSDLVTGVSPPIVVGPIDVAEKRRLVLIVEYGELADVDDWADWCDAVVIH